MRKESTFLASAEIARRAGVITTNYRTKDGRYIVSEKALRALWASIRPEEYVNGLDVEIISETEAARLIAEGGYQIGVPKAESEDVPQVNESLDEETGSEPEAAPSEEEPKEDTGGEEPVETAKEEEVKQTNDEEE